MNFYFHKVHAEHPQNAHLILLIYTHIIGRLHWLTNCAPTKILSLSRGFQGACSKVLILLAVLINIWNFNFTTA